MSLLQKIKRAWQALDYAEVGEFLPYRDKCRVLGIAPPRNAHGYLPHQATIALNLGSEVTFALVDYAISVAQRLEAYLVLLRTADKGAPEAVLTTVRARITAAGVPWWEEALVSPWLEGVTTFLHQHTKVVCLILGSYDLTPEMQSSSLRDTQQRVFPTPVVVVQEDDPLPQPI